LAYTLPGDANVPGNAGHVTDHNNIVDVLTGMGSAQNVLNTAYAGGADPTGAADSSAAIQAALNTGLDVYIPAGTYKAAGMALTADGQQVYGDGPGQTIIKPASGATADVFVSGALPASAGLSGHIRNYAVIRDLEINGTSMAGTTAGQGNGIHFYGARYCRILNVYIHNVPNWAILLDGDNTGSVNFGYNNHIRDCIFDSTPGGIYATNCEANNITDCEFKYAATATAAQQPLFTPRSSTVYMAWLTSGYNYIRGCVFGNLGTYTTEAVRMENSGPCRIEANRFDQVRYAAIHSTAGQNIISGNQIGNASAVGTVAAIQLGSGGHTVVNNTFDATNGSAHWTYAVEEEGAYVGNTIVGNTMKNGTSGYISTNGGSTALQVANNGQLG
jgi:hypothetical protein